MKRRSFIRNTALSLPIFVNGFPIQGKARSAALSGMNGDSDRVMVLIQLNGGNDGLNTLVPLNSYDHLANLRSNIILPESNLLKITDDNAFHPSFSGMANLFDNGKLGIIQNVGYPNQNRSHFRSSDIWATASGPSEYLNTGWLGRYFETKYPGFPEGYPSDDCPDPFAMTVGGGVSETCQGISGNYSVAVKNPNNIGGLPEGSGGDYDPASCYGMHLDYVQTTIRQTNAYAGRITEAAGSGGNQATYPETKLAEKLKIVAQLISGGIQTRVFVVSQGGYDTHANQTTEDDPTIGDHAKLLKELSDAISAFQQDIELLGLEERVIGMTYSEFGRQIRSNHGIGTDHGNAAPLFVFGNCVKPGITGDNPDIPAEVEVQTGLPLQYDFRSVYGSFLMDWFEVPEEDVKAILFDDFQYMPIVNACNDIIDNTDEVLEKTLEVEVFPNPIVAWATVKFFSQNEWIKISLFDARGQELRTLTSQQFAKGEHQIRFAAGDLAAGNYYVRVISEKEIKTKSMIKV